MKKSKRVISVALALIIALSILTVGASAFTVSALGKTTLTKAVYNANATVTLGWTAASGANRYQIAKKMIYDSSYTYTEVNTTTYTDINLGYGTIIYYQVRPMYVKGKSVSYGAWSNTKSVTTLYKPTITSMNFLGNILNINWNRIFGAMEYKLAFKRVGDKAWNYRTVSKTYYNIPNPTKDAVYIAQVCPIAGKVSGPWSSAKTANPNALSKPVITSAGLAAWYTDMLIVSWTVQGPAERFVLYYKRAQDSGWSSINTSSLSEYIDGFDPNTVYYFQVRAFGMNGEASPYSAVKSYTTPAA